jgi:hypothetical protein
LTGSKSRPRKELFVAHRLLRFPPLVKGGQGGGGPDCLRLARGGVGRRNSASSVYSPFAGNDVRKRRAIKAGEAAHAPSTSSIGRAQHGSLAHSKLTGPPPPYPPFTRGGKKRARSRNLRNEFERNARVVQPQLCTTPGRSSCWASVGTALGS